MIQRGNTRAWFTLGLAAVAFAAVAAVGLPHAEAQTTVDSFEQDALGPRTADSFESGILDAYTQINAESSDGNFVAIENSSLARDGTHVLQAQTGSNGDPTFLLSTSGLPGYPGPGASFGCWIRTSDSPDSTTDGTQNNMCMFGVGSETNVSGYAVGFFERKDQLRITRFDAADDRNVLASTTFDVSAETWLDLEVDWGTDGSIQLTLFDASGNQLATLSATDTTYTARGLGFHVDAQHGGNNTIHYDFYRVDPYNQINVDGSDGSFSVLADTPLARHGSNVLEAHTGSNGDASYLLSTSGLGAYPQPGDSFGCWIRTSDRPDPRTGGTQNNMCMFGVGSTTSVSGYGVGLFERKDQLRITRYDAADDRNVLASTGFDVPADTWINVQVDWTVLGTITATFQDANGNEIATLVAVDLTYTVDGIGFHVDAVLDTNATMHYDYYRIS